MSYFRETSAIDLGDTQVAIAGGLHIAALGGLWQNAVLGFSGLERTSEGISLKPNLPGSWRSLSFSVTWRGRQLRIKIEQPDCTVKVVLEAGDAMILTIGGVRHRLDDVMLRVHYGHIVSNSL